MLATLVQPISAPYASLTSSTSRGQLASFPDQKRKGSSKRYSKGARVLHWFAMSDMYQERTLALTVTLSTHANILFALSLVLGKTLSVLGLLGLCVAEYAHDRCHPC